MLLSEVASMERERVALVQVTLYLEQVTVTKHPILFLHQHVIGNTACSQGTPNEGERA